MVNDRHPGRLGPADGDLRFATLLHPDLADAGPLAVNYGELEAPAVMRRRSRDAAVEAMKQSGVDMLDIPAFLRKQAD